jgi:4-hydroxybenzoate polyprenyltransferase
MQKLKIFSERNRTRCSECSLNRLSGYLELIRIKNSVMSSIAVIIGALAVGGDIPVVRLVYAAISAFLIAGASFAINDLCDQELDASLDRSKPLTEGLVSSNEAAFLGISFTFAGFYISVLTNSLPTIFLAGVSALLAYAYSVYLKPYQATIGHLATSYSTGITYIYGWSVFGLGLKSLAFGAVFSMFAMSMTANFSRELIKGIADYTADSEWGIRTLAVTRGPKFASLAAFGAMIVAVTVSYVPLVLGIFRSSYLVVVTLADILFVLLTLLAYLEPTVDNAVRVKDDLLKVMLLGLFAFFLGPRFDYYSVYALPFEVLAIVAFIVMLSRTSLRSLWPLLFPR